MKGVICIGAKRRSERRGSGVRRGDGEEVSRERVESYKDGRGERRGDEEVEESEEGKEREGERAGGRIRQVREEEESNGWRAMGERALQLDNLFGKKYTS